MPPHSYITRIILGIALAAIPAAAFAHTGHGVEGFTGGFVHPLQGFDHIIAMVGVGLIAAKLGGRALWELPAAFLSMMAARRLFGHAGRCLAVCRNGHSFFRRRLCSYTSL